MSIYTTTSPLNTKNIMLIYDNNVPYSMERTQEKQKAFELSCRITSGTVNSGCFMSYLPIHVTPTTTLLQERFL